MDHILLTQSSVDGYSDCCCLLVVVSNVVNEHMCVSDCGGSPVFNSLGHIPRNELAGLQSKSTINLLKSDKGILFIFAMLELLGKSSEMYPKSGAYLYYIPPYTYIHIHAHVLYVCVKGSL
jgi:hypothetical protein